MSGLQITGLIFSLVALAAAAAAAWVAASARRRVQAAAQLALDWRSMADRTTDPADAERLRYCAYWLSDALIRGKTPG